MALFYLRKKSFLMADDGSLSFSVRVVAISSDLYIRLQVQTNFVNQPDPEVTTSTERG